MVNSSIEKKSTYVIIDCWLNELLILESLCFKIILWFRNWYTFLISAGIRIYTVTFMRYSSKGQCRTQKAVFAVKQLLPREVWIMFISVILCVGLSQKFKRMKWFLSWANTLLLLVYTRISKTTLKRQKPFLKAVKDNISSVSSFNILCD